MFKKTWKFDFKGHQIVVENRWNIIMKSSEKLIIDGNVADEHIGWFTILSKELKGRIKSNNEIYQVKARIGNIDFGLKVGCHIFIDDKLVGGDIEKKIR